MSYCVNLDCANPKNPPQSDRCQTCGEHLKLRDRYRALRVLGRGGFGTTFLAEDEGLPGHPTCVIKQIQPVSTAPDAMQQSRLLFEREANTLGKVGQHPQIPRLLDSFELAQNFYLIQEYVNGLTLYQEVRRSGPLDEAKVKTVLQEMLPILGYLHQQKVIHRDIKPANLIRRSIDDRLVLIDFGVVKDQGSQTTISNLKENEVLTAFAVASPGFSPLEQIAKRPVYASDIYSLGMTCLYLLTGKVPGDLDYNQATGELNWPEHIQTSKSFQAVLKKMLAVSVSDRYQSVAEVIEKLSQPEPTVKPAQPTPTLNSSIPLSDNDLVASSSRLAAPRKRARSRTSSNDPMASSKRITGNSSFADLSPIPQLKSKPKKQHPWWNRPLLGQLSMTERIITTFKKKPVEELAISLHQQALKDIESIVEKAEVIDSEKFGSREFLCFAKIQYNIRREDSEYRHLGPSIELLLVGIKTKNAFLKIEQIELSYRGSKQQEFYSHIIGLLSQKLSQEEFRQQCRLKGHETLPLLKSEEGKAAVKTYIEQLDILSEHPLALKLLSLFKEYKLASFSVLSQVSEIIVKLRNTELLNIKGLTSQVIAKSDTFEHLGKIIGVSENRRSPETYARLLQYVALCEKHQTAFSKFQNLAALLEQWNKHYQTVIAIRQEFSSSEYKRPQAFKQAIGGEALYEQDSNYFE